VVFGGCLWWFKDDLVVVCGGLGPTLGAVESRRREGGLCGVGESDGEGRGAVT
jgi:hypothetical protein